MSLDKAFKNRDYGAVRLVSDKALKLEPARELPKGHWRYSFRERAIPGQSLGCLIIREYCGLTLMRQDVAFFVDPELLRLAGEV